MIRFAMKVSQPIGDFYLVSLPASVLCKMCFSRPYERYRKDPTGKVENGSWFQRTFLTRRVNPIADFLKTQEATLPGTLVLAANYTEDGRYVTDEGGDFLSKICWNARKCEIETEGHEDCLYEMNIPDNPMSAMVVDGQHRLGGFKGQDDAVLAMEVPCAIFLDLPIPLQAYIFATINFNQKPVSKSLNYELFAFDIDNEKPHSWSPDKLAVFISRRLNVDSNSPFCGHVKIGAVDCTEDAGRMASEWKVSTATIVAGVMSLITKDSQGDRNRMNVAPVNRRDRSLLTGFHCDDEKLPLRAMYIANDDDLIYTIVLNFFIATESIFNNDRSKNLVFHKTAGVTALFKVLQELLVDVFMGDTVDLSRDMWIERFLSQGRVVDFNDPYLLGSSGSHAGRIRDMLFLMTGYKKIDDFCAKECFGEYSRLWTNAKVNQNA